MKVLVKLFIAYALPFLAINVITHPFFLHKAFDETIDIEHIETPDGVLSNGYLHDGHSVEEKLVNWKNKISITTEKPLLKMMKAEEEYFIEQSCFDTKTYYLANEEQILQNADQIKIELTFEDGSKYFLKPNDHQCYDQPARIQYYIAEITPDRDQIRKDIQEYGIDGKLTGGIRVLFYQRPKYMSLPILLYLTFYPGTWSIMLLWKKLHEFIWSK